MLIKIVVDVKTHTHTHIEQPTGRLLSNPIFVILFFFYDKSYLCYSGHQIALMGMIAVGWMKFGVEW